MSLMTYEYATRKLVHGIFRIVYFWLCDSSELLALAIIVIGTTALRCTSLSLSLVFPVYPRQTWSKGFVAEVLVIFCIIVSIAASMS